MNGLHFPYHTLILCGPIHIRSAFQYPKDARENGALRYIFEDYTFDTVRRELHRRSDVVAIAPQVFDLLDYLIRNREAGCQQGRPHQSRLE
ncbi:DNA-binding response OmpR family regulator [Bradyrhizobium sp. USDA 4470]